jgi:hypothetical protein
VPDYLPQQNRVKPQEQCSERKNSAFSFLLSGLKINLIDILKLRNQLSGPKTNVDNLLITEVLSELYKEPI